MASLMNLALMAGALGTKYLNLIFPVDRGDYGNLPALVVVAVRDRLGAAAGGNCRFRPARALSSCRPVASAPQRACSTVSLTPSKSP